MRVEGQGWGRKNVPDNGVALEVHVAAIASTHLETEILRREVEHRLAEPQAIRQRRIGRSLGGSLQPVEHVDHGLSIRQQLQLSAGDVCVIAHAFAAA